MKKRPYEYFTKYNLDHVYIEKRESRFNSYVVYEGATIIKDLINHKKDALYLANQLIKDKIHETL